MPSSLNSIRNRFLRRLKVVDSAFERHLVSPVVKFRSDRYALQDGLVSHLWQYWSAFCREVVIASAQGAITKSGVMTTSPFAELTQAEIAYVAMRLAKGNSIGRIRALTGSHLEPTWGDISKLSLIAGGIDSSNRSALLTAFGVASSIQDLQLCRNACAHVNLESYRRFRGARVRYIPQGFAHPSELMYWVVPSTGDFAWRSWMDELEIISDFAIV